MRGMRTQRLLPAAFLLALAVAASAAARQAPPAQQPAAAAQPAAPGLHGVRNFTQVDSAFACGGALSPTSMASLKEAGFVTVVNLRAESEEGANVQAEMEAAVAAGIHYVHLPFSSGSPDPTKVDEFLKVVADPANQPVLLHCTTGGRASMFWAIKRVVVDGWSVEKAMAELPDLAKNASQPLKTFALEYLKTHGK